MIWRSDVNYLAIRSIGFLQDIVVWGMSSTARRGCGGLITDHYAVYAYLQRFAPWAWFALKLAVRNLVLQLCTLQQLVEFLSYLDEHGLRRLPNVRGLGLFEPDLKNRNGERLHSIWDTRELPVAGRQKSELCLVLLQMPLFLVFIKNLSLQVLASAVRVFYLHLCQLVQLFLFLQISLF